MAKKSWPQQHVVNLRPGVDQSDPKAHHIQVDNALIGGYMDEDDPDEFNPEYLR